MPHPARKGFYQKALWWPSAGFDQFNRPVKGDPVEIDVRWVEHTRTIMGPEGKPVSLDAQMATNAEVQIDDQVWLGTLAEYQGTGSVGFDDGIMIVVTAKVDRGLKNRNTRREYGLAYFQGNPSADG